MTERKNKIEILRRLREGEDPAVLYDLMEGSRDTEVWTSKDGITYENSTGLQLSVTGLKERKSKLRRIIDFTIMTLVPVENDFGSAGYNVTLKL